MLGSDHPDTLITWNNLALGYLTAGRLDEAITANETLLVVRERVLGDRHPDTLTSRNNVAVAYQAASRLDEAIAILEPLVGIRAQVLGPAHPHTLRTRHNVANAYRLAKAPPAKAVPPMFLSTLADTERALGSDHPLIETIRENLALAEDALN